MSYEIQDVNGEKMPGPTISGLEAMRTLLEKQKAEEFPVACHLMEFGHTTKLIVLAKECERLSSKTNDKNIRHSFRELAKCARAFNRTPENMLIITV